MEKFKKLDLDTSVDVQGQSQITSARMKKSRKLSLNTFGHSRRFIIVVSIIVLFVLFSIFTIIIPGIKLIASAKKTIAQAKITAAAAKNENIELVASSLVKTKADLLDTQKAMNGLVVLEFIPIGAWYYSDGQHLLSAGSHAIDAANVLVNSISPYADVLGLKGKGSFVGGTAQQRLQTAVQTLDKITPRIEDIAKYLALVRKDIDAVNPNHYPSLFGGKGIKTQLTQAKLYTDEADTFVNNSRPLIKLLPELLGVPSEKKYLIIFQNDKELRPTGGFLTAYAVFRMDQGVIRVDNSDDIYTLDGTIANKPPAPKPILDYLPNEPRLNLRNTNLSPDFTVSMATFYNMYKTAPQAIPIQGIIGVDTQALVSAMDILGDIQIGSDTFSTKIVPQCNCPDVIYKLEVYSDQPANHIKVNRKGIIGDLLYAIMSKAFASSPKKYWGPLFQAMLTQVQQKHVLFNMFNSNAEQGIEALNAAGRIVPFDGDYLHINEANFGGAKSNLFITEAVTQKYDVKSDGSIVKTVVITYKNPFRPSDCNLERGNLCLNATLRDWVRLYVPKGSQLINSQGSEVKVTSYDDLGKTVFDGFLEVRPQGSATYTISYTLPFKSANGMLPVLTQKQPGTNANQYTLVVNGNTIKKFPLLSDTQDKVNF